LLNLYLGKYSLLPPIVAFHFHRKNQTQRNYKKKLKESVSTAALEL